jgi:hypothetical protein
MMSDVNHSTFGEAFHEITDVNVSTQDKASYERLAIKYPAISFMIKDPETFIKVIRNRYNSQKTLHPTKAFHFDYSEIGLPVVDDIVKEVDAKIIGLTQLKSSLENASSVMKFLHRHKNYVSALEYLSRLKQEAAGYKKKNKISYQCLIELCYFYTRIIGYYDRFTYFSKTIQSAPIRLAEDYNGYKKLTVEEELKNYIDRNFQLFPSQTKAATMSLYEPEFVNAFNSAELSFILVPSHHSYGSEIFHYLNGLNIFIVGTVGKRVDADTFIMNSGLFWLHDLRHATQIWWRQVNYSASLSSFQQKKINLKMAQWRTELLARINEVNDKDLRGALKYYLQIYYHDNGYLFVPSEFKMDKIHRMVKFTYFFQWATSQLFIKAGKSPFKKFDEAHIWLTTFWKEKVEAEKAITVYT